MSRFAAGVALGLTAGGIGRALVHADEPQRKCKNVEIVFLGTGPSVSVPAMKCLLSHKPCKVCTGAVDTDKNRRNNPSLLLRVPCEQEQTFSADGRMVNEATTHKNILIDCGKTFRESAVRFFQDLGVKYIDNILLTHYHADAVLGLDDIRDFSRILRLSDHATNTPTQVASIPVYCDAPTLQHLGGVFPYLMPKKPAADAKPELARFVSSLDWNVVEGYKTYNIAGLPIRILPVEHGFDCECMGYEVESPECRFVYISDVSAFPERTHSLLKTGRPIDVLVLDALFLKRKHNTHFSLPDALECIRDMRPKKAYLTGMSHELDYHTLNAELQKLSAAEGLDVEMGYDGLSLSLPLLQEPHASPLSRL